MNLEYRFPLVDMLAFPVLAIQDIRGMFFVDLGAAYLENDLWIDPNTGFVRVDETGGAIPFDVWDSANDRLQDVRGSYGAGFQFLFLGGLQFNWVWAKRLPFTDFEFDALSSTVVPIEGDNSGTQTQFYITFDF
jgi:outer membrane protein assembly factor BamA